MINTVGGSEMLDLHSLELKTVKSHIEFSMKVKTVFLDWNRGSLIGQIETVDLHIHTKRKEIILDIF